MKKTEHPTSNTQHPTLNEGAAKRRFDLEERMLAHAVRIVALYDSLPPGSGAKQIGNQFIRSGTSPYLHHGEVEAAESLDDFVHKLKVCHKELRESRRWLRLIKRVPLIKPAEKLDPLIDETNELIKVFWASIRTAEREGNDSTRVREDPPEMEAPPSALNVERWKLDVDRSPIPPSRKRPRR